jgi:hypothetical protein
MPCNCVQICPSERGLPCPGRYRRMPTCNHKANDTCQGCHVGANGLTESEELVLDVAAHNLGMHLIKRHLDADPSLCDLHGVTTRGILRTTLATIAASGVKEHWKR